VALPAGVARTEALEVHEVKDHLHPLRRDTLLGDEPLPRGEVDGHVTEDAREARRDLLPGDPAVADVHGRDAGKVEQGGQGLQVVLAMDQVRRLADRVEAVHHRDGGRP
jgi:hypothetical protein